MWSLKMIHYWLASHVSKAEITQTADGMWQISISASFLVSFFFFVKLNELLMFSTEKQHLNLSWDKETIRLDGNSFQE